MEDYKPNSNRYKEEQKKTNLPEKRAEKVVTGKVVTKQKSKISKVANEFVSGDAHSVGSYILRDVVIPAAKKLISDIFTDGIDILLYGESGRKGRRSTADKFSYSNCYNGSSVQRNNPGPLTSRYSYDDIVLTSRGEAQDVLDRMFELMDTYGLVRVADLYDLVGITGNYTDNKYGWTNIQSAEIVRVRDGYLIKMPRAMPID